MTSDNAGQDIDTLNDLIVVTLDSADCYEKATEDVSDRQLKRLFTRRGLERRRIAHDLQALVRKLGGRAQDEGSILARVHRSFIDLKSALFDDGNKIVIDEIERAEDHVKSHYQKALGRYAALDEARQAIERAFICIRLGYDQAKFPVTE